jgi:hypothetical protein
MNTKSTISPLIAAICALAILGFSSASQAGPWAIVASQFADTQNCKDKLVDCRDGIYTIDLLGYPTPRVYGPFLQDQLDPVIVQDPQPPVPNYAKQDIYDIAVLPGGKQALVSLFGSQEVLRIDVSNPKKPILTGRIKMEYDTGTLDKNSQPVIYSFFAEDISISPDGRVAIVSDGGFSPYLGFIDLRTFTLKSIQKLEVEDSANPGTMVDVGANAISIAPDNQTVLFADYYRGKVHYGRLRNSRDSVVDINSIFLCNQIDPLDASQCLGLFGRPVNITIDPQYSLFGMTAIVNIASVSLPSGDPNTPGGFISVLKILSPGVVVPGSPFFVSGLPVDTTLDEFSPGGNQSTAFGTLNRAYIHTQPSPQPGDDPDHPRPNLLAQVKVIKPGQVKVMNSNFAELKSTATSQLFGVDTLAACPLTGFVLASNPSTSIINPTLGRNKLTLVNEWTRSKQIIELRSDAIPVGVAIK